MLARSATSPSRAPLLSSQNGRVPREGQGGMAGIVDRLRAGVDWRGDGPRRTGLLVMCVICTLASGSNYAYSAYAPQIASQLRLTSTQINLVGTAGNFGVYMTGPLWGAVIDHKGARTCLLPCSICLFVGYYLIHLFYTFTIPIRPSPTAPVSALSLALLSFAMFLTGCGGSGGVAAAVNTAARSVPDSMRATVTGTVLSGFGLSAFMFSTLGHGLFQGDADGLLRLLSWGTAIPVFVASWVLVPIPPEAEEGKGYQRVGSHEGRGPSFESEHESLGRRQSYDLSHRGQNRTSLSRSRSPHSRLNASSRPRKSSVISFPEQTHYTPIQMFRTIDFHLLFWTMVMVCGTGLMYINNVGTVVLALGREGRIEYDQKRIAGWQATQVGTVSVWNCSGRIIGGIVSDLLKTRFGVQRIWFLPIVCLLFISSQLSALLITSVSHLWLVSSLLGLAYGSLFNAAPMLVLEWFGLTAFSQNYGWACLSPIIGGNVLNLVFGRVYDAHSISRIGLPNAARRLVALARRAGVTLPGDSAGQDCLIGTECYAGAFKVAMAADFVALGLAIWAGTRRDRMRGEGAAEKGKVLSESDPETEGL